MECYSFWVMTILKEVVWTGKKAFCFGSTSFFSNKDVNLTNSKSTVLKSLTAVI